MHELSIALSILDIAAEEAERRGVGVSVIHLRLGPLSGVVSAALLSAFEMAREESPFPEARLAIEQMPVQVYCQPCQAERQPVSMQQLCCPVCGQPTPDVRGGRELEITALEVIDGIADPVG